MNAPMILHHAVIDRQHRAIFQVFEKIKKITRAEKINKTDNILNTIDGYLKELQSLVLGHFAEEEHLMNQLNDADCAEHIRKHIAAHNELREALENSLSEFLHIKFNTQFLRTDDQFKFIQIIKRDAQPFFGHVETLDKELVSMLNVRGT